MEKSGLPRHESIDRLTAGPTATTTDAAVALWEPVATEIIAVVGVNGFDSLFARSVDLTQATFPWLDGGPAALPDDQRFAGLKASLDGAAPELARAANRLLLTIFTDILASLIGEQLTTRILDSAWGNGAPNKLGKDLTNDQ